MSETRGEWVVGLTCVICSCTAGLDIERPLRCESDRECPSGTLCREEVSLCLTDNPSDPTPPELIGPPIFDPPLASVGEKLTITFEVSEPLLVPAIVQVGQGGESSSVPVTQTRFRASYEVTARDENAVVLIKLVDVAGNVSVIDVGLLPADVTPPVLNELRWTDEIDTVGPQSSLSFSGTGSVDIASLAAVLIDQNENTIAPVPVAVLVPGGVFTETRFSGSIELAELELNALFGVDALTVQLDVSDEFGNRIPSLDARLPARAIDIVAPVTTLLSAPPAEVRVREVEVAFTSDEADVEFRCRVDEHAPEPCVSPLLLTLRPGVHTIEIAAIDSAGNRETNPPVVSVAVAPVWSDIVLSGRAACGIASDGSLACWGDGAATAGFLADSAATPTSIVVDDDRVTGWSAVSLFSFSEFSMTPNQPEYGAVCARFRNQDFYCLGDPPLGDGEQVVYARPTRVPQTWAQLQVADSHRCAIDQAGGLWCWGNGSGTGSELGLGPTVANPFSPQRVGDDSDWLELSVAPGLTCGIREDDNARSLWCWGDDDEQRVGDGLDSPVNVPTRIDEAASGETLNDWLQISVSAKNACGIRRAEGAMNRGSLWCWGSAEDYLLEPNRAGEISRPVRIGSDDGWASVSVGNEHRCAVTASGEGYCWGSDRDDQVSPDGNAEDELPLTRVADPAGWSVFAAGDRVSCGINRDGTLRCFGDADALGAEPVDGFAEPELPRP